MTDAESNAGTPQERRPIFRNRYFVYSLLAFSVLWVVGSLVAEVLNLGTPFTVLVGVLVGAVVNRIIDWLNEYRDVREEAENHAV